MSDNEEQLYEPTVRPREREDFETETPESGTRPVSIVPPRSRRRPEIPRIGFMMPTIYELPMVPGPDIEQ